jgi:hypothetical protein
VRVDDLDAFLAALKDHAGRYPYTVGWIDCLTRGRHMGRGILMAGEWAQGSDVPSRFPAPLPRVTLPFDLPSALLGGRTLGRLSVGAFNELFFRRHIPREREGLVHWETFFYPLDVVREWNRMYGPRGFTQYQCVLPERSGPGAARRVLEILTRSGSASFLCVTQAVVDALNEQVIREGGRIYLTKDGFTRADHFRAMEPRLPAFLDVRRKWDPATKIRSAQSVRLFGDRLSGDSK